LKQSSSVSIKRGMYPDISPLTIITQRAVTKTFANNSTRRGPTSAKAVLVRTRSPDPIQGWKNLGFIIF